MFVDLSDKAPWHLAFNKGFIPVLEVPSGEMFPESGINMEYAMQVAGPDQGISLIPSDPVKAAQMRTTMAKFDSEFLPVMFKVYLGKYKEGPAQEFLDQGVPMMERYCAQTTDGKWIMGTDDLTMADIHIGAMWDFLFSFSKGQGLRSCFDKLNFAENAPKWHSYMERLRAHPKIEPACMSLEAASRMSKRLEEWTSEEKCQLNLGVLVGGVFPDLP